MKDLIIVALLLSFGACSSQKKSAETQTDDNQKENAAETFVSAKMNKMTSFGDMVIKLKEVQDSRCPEGVTCIWAGEAKATVGIYENGKLEKDIYITFSPKDTHKENPILVFEDDAAAYYAYGLTPYPSQKTKTEQMDYELLMLIKTKATN